MVVDIQRLKVHARDLVYIIEQYKFEAAAVFYVMILAAIMPLMALADRTANASQLNMGQAYYEETPMHTPAHPNDVLAAGIAANAAMPAIKPSTIWPIKGKVTSEFGVPHRPWQHRHSGIDISSGNKSGKTAVAAFRDGTVIATVRSFSGYGNYVQIDHGNGLSSVYAHLFSIKVVEGQKVKLGDTIGYEGSTGVSTGTHLHFEIRQNDVAVDPRAFVAETL